MDEAADAFVRAAEPHLETQSTDVVTPRTRRPGLHDVKFADRNV
jgi:hypothetical protein